MKHTLGPWKAVHDADGDFAIFAGDKLITVTNSDTTWDEANARLIAASPTMLEALEAIVSEADQSNGGKGAQLPIVLHIRRLAEAAIKKAKGE